MFKFLKKDKIIKYVIDEITKNLNQNLDAHRERQDEKFDLVLEHLEKLRFELSNLDQRITKKELKDRADYGQLKYQISSLQKFPKQKTKSNGH